MITPAAHLRQIRDALEASTALPLSVRQARAVAALLDVMPDRAYGAWRSDPDVLWGATDRAAYRAAVLVRSDAMATIATLFDDPPTAHLAVRDIPVPAQAAAALDVADFMVSVYNDHTVPRLMIVHSDGSMVLAKDVFEQALVWWERLCL